MDLLWGPPRGCIRNGPGRFFFNLKFRSVQEFDQRGNEVSIDDTFDVNIVPRHDIGNRPARFFSDAFLGAPKQRQQIWKCTAVDDYLRLKIVTSHDVSHSPQRGGLYCGRWVHQQFHKPHTHTTFYDCLDLIVGAIT